MRLQNIGTNLDQNVWFAHQHIFSVNLRLLVFVHLKPHFKRMENVFHVIILTSGTMIGKNVKAVLQHMYLIRKEENVFVQQANLLIQDLHVSNVYNQVTGIQTREDVCNVQMNKFMTV